MANNRKLHWNYSHNYFKIELRPITGEMKCRWHRDSVLIRHNGRQNFWHWVSGFWVRDFGTRDRNGTARWCGGGSLVGKNGKERPKEIQLRGCEVVDGRWPCQDVSYYPAINLAKCPLLLCVSSASFAPTPFGRLWLAACPSDVTVASGM